MTQIKRLLARIGRASLAVVVVTAVVGVPVLNFLLVGFGVDPPRRPDGGLLDRNPDVSRLEKFGILGKDRNCLWSPIPKRPLGWDQEFVNALGFRGPLPRDEKTGPRIAVLGDTQAFGALQKDKATWTRRLEAATRKSIPDFEAFDLAVPGHSITQAIPRFLQFAPTLKLDIVLIAFSGESEGEVRSHGESDRELMRRADQPSWLRLDGWRHLTVVRAVATALGLRFEAPETLDGRPRVSLDEFTEDLLRLIAQVRSFGGRPILVVPVWNDALPNSSRHAEYMARLESVARDAVVPRIDLPHEFERSCAEFRVPDVKAAKAALFAERENLSEIGHLWVAYSIARSLPMTVPASGATPEPPPESK